MRELSKFDLYKPNSEGACRYNYNVSFLEARRLKGINLNIFF